MKKVIVANRKLSTSLMFPESELTDSVLYYSLSFWHIFHLVLPLWDKVFKFYKLKFTETNTI